MQHFASVKTLKRLFRLFVTLLVVLGLVYASYEACLLYTSDAADE